MPKERTPLFVRLPRTQAAALDRLADATGRPKQSLVSEFLGDRLTIPRPRPYALGRVEISSTPEVGDDVLTLEEVARLLKVPADAVVARARSGGLPGRRFGNDWRFARMAVLEWLAGGDAQKRGRAKAESQATGR